MSTENEEWREDSKSENTDAGRDGNRSYNREGGYNRPIVRDLKLIVKIVRSVLMVIVRNVLHIIVKVATVPIVRVLTARVVTVLSVLMASVSNVLHITVKVATVPTVRALTAKVVIVLSVPMATVRNVLHTIVKVVTVPIVRDTITITDRRDSHVRYVVRGITIRMLNTVRKNRLNTKNNLLIRMNRSV